MLRYLAGFVLVAVLSIGAAAQTTKLISPTDPNYQQELMRGTQGVPLVPNQQNAPPPAAAGQAAPAGRARTKLISPKDPNYLQELMQGTQGVPTVPNDTRR